MSRAPKATLFMTTAEMPRHLALVLEGIKRQSEQDFELMICDDGSGPETQKIIQDFCAQSPLKVQHFWQENQGFRKCRILNQALRVAQGRLAIFLDGDCIPHRHYVRDHLEQWREGFYSCGRRLDLGEKISATLTPDRVAQGFFDRPNFAIWKSVRQGDSKNFQRSIRVRNSWLRRLLGMNRVADLLGSNYSVARKDLVAINGFDEDYEGYGREDTDVELRLQHLGLKIQSVKGVALQFHVWHPRRAFTPKNDDRLEILKNSRRIRCKNGLVAE
jgi:glycosyltransferase involved in cell wall biosynthesis